MDANCMAVSDELWEKIEPLIPGKAGDPGVTARNNHRFMEAVLGRLLKGCPWRDLPKEFGNWNSQFIAIWSMGQERRVRESFQCHEW